MPEDKPHYQAGYTSAATELCEQVLLEVFRYLGRYRDHFVLVGGLVPRYLIDHQFAPPVRHCGSLDVDLAVQTEFDPEVDYRTIAERLQHWGFVRAVNESGRERQHSFVRQLQDGRSVILDFLTHPYQDDSQLMQRVQRDLRAIGCAGMGLAFQDPVSMTLTGFLPEHKGEVTVELRVSNIVPFVVLKALALENRGEPKDAYDLCYALMYYGAGPSAVATAFRPYRDHPSIRPALAVLEDKFGRLDREGVRLYAYFLGREGNDYAQDCNAARAVVAEFLRELDA